MAESDNMDTSGGEDTELDYLQEMTQFGDSLAQSTDSLQGSIKIPTFSMGQSIGTDLQGSQGFHVLNSGHLNFLQKPEVINSENMFSRQTTSGNESVNNVPISVSSGINLQSNTLIFSNNQIGSLNVMGNQNQFQILNMHSDQQDSNYVPVSTEARTDIADSGSFIEVFDGGSSDEKSGKGKTSPKRRGKKSRSTSSTGNEMSSKYDACGPSPSRLDSSDAQSAGEMGFKPSLLDEILTEKTLALMKSPQVVQFLQAQQQKLARSKRIAHNHRSDS